MTRGKKFEEEIGHSLKALSKSVPAFAYRNSNLPLPICDHLVWHNGLTYLLEEKETHSNSFSFGAITDKERKNLDDIIRAGGGSWVLIKWISGNKSRVFASRWLEWLTLECCCGYDPEAKRQKRGSGSFTLEDHDRPRNFVELDKVDRKDFAGHSLGRHWDLSPLFLEVL